MGLNETIDPGWLLFIESWENDGDFYKTIIQTGWSDRDLMLLFSLNLSLQEFQNNLDDHTVDQFMQACRKGCPYKFAKERDKFVGEFLSCFEGESEEERASHLNELIADEMFGVPEADTYWDHQFYLRRISEIKGVWIERSGMTFPAGLTTFYPE